MPHGSATVAIPGLRQGWNFQMSSYTARAENRRFWLLSARCAHTKAPHETDLLLETQRALNRPGRARTAEPAVAFRFAVRYLGSSEQLSRF